MKKNVDKNISKAISTHRKKLKNLTKNAELPFSPNETVNNLSSYKLTNDELELLKIGLGFSIKPPRLNKTNTLASFEKIHYTMKNKLIDKNSATHLKTEIAHLAQNYISSYRPSSTDLKKHRILRTLKNNHNIIILKPDKGNGVVILDRNIYLDSCFNCCRSEASLKRASKAADLFQQRKHTRQEILRFVEHSILPQCSAWFGHNNGFICSSYPRTHRSYTFLSTTLHCDRR